MYRILIVLIFFSLMSCEYHGVNAQLKIFVIQGLSGDTMAIINEKDIVCVDWQRQSFKFTQEVSSKIDKSPLLASSKYFFSVTLESVELYRVFVLSKYASHSIPKESPYVIFNDKPLYSIFDENWLVIRYYRKKDNYLYKQVFSERLYKYLKRKNLMSGFRWECTQNKNIENSIMSNKEIGDSFRLKFGRDYN